MYQEHLVHSGKGIDLYLARMTLFYLDDSLHGHSFHESHRKDLSLNAGKRPNCSSNISINCIKIKFLNL